MEILFAILTFTLVSFLGLFFIFSLLLVSLYAGQSVGDPKYAPVKGTIFHQLLNYNTIFDYYVEVAKTVRTFRLLGLGTSDLFTTDTVNTEHILKSQFSKYSKGKHDEELMVDLLGRGIFAVNGETWKQQRKLASYEFSTRVLSDFSCSTFRTNAAKLVGFIS